MSTNEQDLQEVREILESRAPALARQFDRLAEAYLAGRLAGQAFANEFNGVRVDFVVDHGGGEFSDQLLDFEEGLAGE